MTVASVILISFAVTCILGGAGALVWFLACKREPTPATQELRDSTIIEDGFETFYDQDGIGELTIPFGWRVAWLEEDEQGDLPRPECDAKTAPQREVYSPPHSAVVFTVHKRHKAALWRRFFVGKGSRVTASAMTMGVSRDNVSNYAGLGMVIRLNPYGVAEDFTSPENIEGEWYGVYNPGYSNYVWYPVSAECTALADYVTVFLVSHGDYPGDINAAHWDDFVLEIEGESGGGNGSGTDVDYDEIERRVVAGVKTALREGTG